MHGSFIHCIFDVSSLKYKVMLISQLEIGQHFKWFRKNVLMVYLGYLDGVHYYHYKDAINECPDENSTVADLKVTAVN